MSGLPRQAAGSWDNDHVIRHDLRPPEAVRRFVKQQLWKQGTRALVIVRAEDLDEMRETLFDIAAGRRMLVIYLVIGRPPEGRTHPALLLPGVLSSDGCATLWVSDDEGRGCGWWIDSDAPLMAAETVLGDGAQLAFDLLDDCLQIRDVFDRVLEEAVQMGDHVASPGLIAFGGRLTEQDRLAARIRALRLVTDSAGPSHAPDPEAGRIFHLSRPSPDHEVEMLFTGGSAIETARREAGRAADDAARLSGLVAARLFLTARAGRRPDDLVADARRQADVFRNGLGRVLNAAHQPGAGMDDETVARIEGQGFDTDRFDWSPREKLLDDLREAVEQRLRTSSLDQVRQWLLRLADTLTPRGSAGYLPELTKIKIAGLRIPVIPLAPYPAWLLSVLAVASALAGLAGTLGAAVPLVLFAVIMFILSRRPTGPDPSDPRPGRLAPAVYLPDLAAGFAVGFEVQAKVTMSALAALAALVVGVLAGLVAVGGWWTAAVHDWVERAAVTRLRSAVTELNDLLRRVVDDEWCMASARAAAADTALACARALEEIGTVLREQARALGRNHQPDRPDAEHRLDDQLDAMFVMDLRDAVTASLEGLWDQAKAGSPSGSWNLAGERMVEHLDEYERHLSSHDVTDPPPFAREHRNRQYSLSGWGPPQQLADLLRTPSDGPLVQLCRDRHVSLLSVNRVRGLRFAPAAMQETITEELARRGGGPLLSEMQWTRSGSLAGVLRLLAPRTGVVETSWDEGDHGDF